jgi:hypothetical protein
VFLQQKHFQIEHAKVIYHVISTKRKSEPAEKQSDKGKCQICGHTGHKMRKCLYDDSSMTLEENKKAAEKIIEEWQAAKDEKNKQTKSKKEAAKMNLKEENLAEVHKAL